MGFEFNFTPKVSPELSPIVSVCGQSMRKDFQISTQSPKDHKLCCAQLAKVGTQIVSELGPTGWSVVMASALLDTQCSPVARQLVWVLISTAHRLNC